VRAPLAIASALLAACTGIVDVGVDAAAGGGASDAGAPASGFGYPVGDLATAPAGGWVVTQVLSHFYAAWGGRHLAQDLGHPDGGLAAIGAPVHAIGRGVVRYAGPNSSTYLNVVLIEHDLGAEGIVCSFYGHVNAPLVATGDTVEAGQQITTVADWAVAGGGDSSNSHLHYVVLSRDLCDASAAASGALVCGYDQGGESSAVDLATEPARYTSAGDVCGTQQYPDAFLSPSQFIAGHR
jgi:murein DD-endopeptidase MepM/ murein hydrolase activator NlpD